MPTLETQHEYEEREADEQRREERQMREERMAEFPSKGDNFETVARIVATKRKTTRLVVLIDPDSFGHHVWRREIRIDGDAAQALYLAIARYSEDWEIGEGMTLTVEQVEERDA